MSNKYYEGVATCLNTLMENSTLSTIHSVLNDAIGCEEDFQEYLNEEGYHELLNYLVEEGLL